MPIHKFLLIPVSAEDGARGTYGCTILYPPSFHTGFHSPIVTSCLGRPANKDYGFACSVIQQLRSFREEHTNKPLAKEFSRFTGQGLPRAVPAPQTGGLDAGKGHPPFYTCSATAASPLYKL